MTMLPGRGRPSHQNPKPRRAPEGVEFNDVDRYTFRDAVMDIPISHKKNTQLSVHLHQYHYGKVLDIRYWHVNAAGMKTKGKGVRFSLEHAEQLAQRLLRLYNRHQREDQDVVDDGTSQASGSERE